MEGFKVWTAGSVAEARALVAQMPFDLITLDINMPGESGLVLLEELSPRQPDTMVLMMTALADVRIGVKALKNGAYDYLLKPIDLEEFLVAVRRALYHRELELENRAYLTRLELTMAYRTQELNEEIESLRQRLEAIAAPLPTYGRTD